jgi:hypothetical protein
LGRRNRYRIGGGGKSAGGREITKHVVEDGEAVSAEMELRRNLDALGTGKRENKTQSVQW